METKSRRIDSIDLLRGIVMVIMMLDHTRDFIHNAAREFDPTDLSRTNITLYVLQWLTAHIISIVLHLAFGKPTAWLFGSPLNLVRRHRVLGSISSSCISRGLRGC